MKRWIKVDLMTACKSAFIILHQIILKRASRAARFGRKIKKSVAHFMFKTSLEPIFDRILQLRLTSNTNNNDNSKNCFTDEVKDLPYMQSRLFRTMLLHLNINFIFGISILLLANVFAHFIIHLICLTITMYITMWIISEFLIIISQVKNHMNKEIGEGSALVKSLYIKVYRKTNLIPCVIVILFFFWGIFSQGYIKVDLVGIYAVFLVTIVVSISVVGYMGYIWLLWFLYRINKSSLMKEWASEAIPAKAPVLVLLAELTNKAKMCFFVEGFIYVFQYFILIPDLSTYNISVVDNLSFVLTWVALFIVIVLGFPAIVIFQEKCITLSVDNVKQFKLRGLDLQYKAICGDIMKAYYFEAMMGNVLKSDDYPIKTRSFCTHVISIATFILHATTLLSQIPGTKETLKLLNLI